MRLFGSDGNVSFDDGPIPITREMFGADEIHIKSFSLVPGLEGEKLAAKSSL